MKKLFYLLSLLLLTHYALHSQDSDPTTQARSRAGTLFLEIGGPGALYSLNYQHSFFLSKERNNNKINLRGGFSLYPESFGTPVGLNIELGKRKHFLSITGTRTFRLSGEDNLANVTSGLGYVYRAPGGFYAHVHALYMFVDEPFSYWGSEIESLPWAGIGLGFTL